MTEKAPLTKETLDAMSKEQVADTMATPAGRAEVARVMAGGRVVTKEMLLDPGSLTVEEVATHWDAIQAAAKAAKETH